MVRVIILSFLCLIGCTKNPSNQEIGNEKDSLLTEESGSFKIEEDTLKSRNSSEKDIIAEKQESIISDKNVATTICEKCNIKLVVEVEKNLDSLSYNHIYNLLCTIDESCSNNAEFSEFSNRMLFSVLQRYPTDFIKVLDKYPELQKNYLFKELSGPLLDYDIQWIIGRIKSAEVDGKVKRKAIESLQKIK